MLRRWQWRGRRPGSIPVVLGLMLSVLGTPPLRAAAPEALEEGYLGGRGPYRGRVIDAATRQPLAGGVVLAVWRYDVPVVGHMAQVVYDVLEVVTDAQGSFTVEAPAIERQAPPRTRFPTFTIFKPGYIYFRGLLADPDVLAERHLRPLLAIVELTPNAGVGRAARSRNSPTLTTDIPAEKTPNFLRALEEEHQGLLREP